MSQTKINYVALAFYGILIFLVIIAVAYVLKINPVYSAISSLISNFKLPSLPEINLNSIFQWIQANPLATTIAGFLGTTAVGYIIKNWQTNKLLDQQTNALAQAQSELSTVQSQAKDYQNQLSVFASDTTASELQTTIGSMKTDFDKVVSNKDTEIHTLEKTITQLQQQLDARPVIKIKEVV